MPAGMRFGARDNDSAKHWLTSDGARLFRQEPAAFGVASPLTASMLRRPAACHTPHHAAAHCSHAVLYELRNFVRMPVQRGDHFGVEEMRVTAAPLSVNCTGRVDFVAILEQDRKV